MLSWPREHTSGNGMKASTICKRRLMKYLAVADRLHGFISHEAVRTSSSQTSEFGSFTVAPVLLWGEGIMVLCGEARCTDKIL
jgi:hypothetical protein